MKTGLQELRENRATAEAFVERELRRALPAGWTAERSGGCWIVTVDRSGGWRSYEVRLDPGSLWIIVTHGNTDAGAMRLERLMLRATVIPLEGLPFVGMDLARCFAHLFASEPPNRWGLT
jgi:hypothetical protein